MALHPVSLSVERAGTLAVTGPSGVGKSTLLLVLSGLVRPSTGSVTFCGRDLGALDERTRDRLRREAFGFVFQAANLVPELTILENVALPLRLAGVAVKEARERAMEKLRDLGVDALARRQVGDVSGGQLQRAAIARALVHQPMIVFADEPTGALDVRNADLVMDLLLGHASLSGAAVVLVTHDPRLAARAGACLGLEAEAASS